MRREDTDTEQAPETQNMENARLKPNKNQVQLISSQSIYSIDLLQSMFYDNKINGNNTIHSFGHT